MKKNVFYIALTTSLLTLCLPAQAQQEREFAKIGLLEPGFSPAKSATSVCIDGFRRGLGDLGYTEGPNVIIESRFADGQLELLPKLVAELLRLEPDVIWTHSIAAAWAAKQVTAVVPVVVGVAVDFVDHGLVMSLAKPGGNVTGLEHRDRDITGKRLEVLKQAVPAASRIAVLTDPANPAHAGVPEKYRRRGSRPARGGLSRRRK